MVLVIIMLYEETEDCKEDELDRVGHTSVNGHNNHSLGIALVGGINVATGDVDALGNRSSSSFTREQYTTLERF